VTSEAQTERPLVLIVEDDADVADSLASLLDAELFDVEVAADGIAALDLARRRRPAVVLLDVMLPRLDGVGVAAELRRVPGLADVPLILASAGRQLDETARQMATPYFLRKPFHLDELLTLIRRAVRSGHEPERPA
jgi:DNA-binding response OmpR family regulator